MQDNTDQTPPAGTPKVVLLVGAAHGIGREAALQIVGRGQTLAVCDKDTAGLDALKADMPEGATLHFGAVDITRLDDITAFVAEVETRFGGIDSAICNAGGMISLVHEGTVSSNIRGFLDIPPEDWRSIVHLNLIGSLNLAHAVLPGMIDRGAGRLVLVSSVSGLVGGPGLSIYAASKGGVIAFAKSLAREYGTRGISVTSVAPGGVATRAFPKDSPSVAKRVERIPMGRLAEPGEIANVITYLALDAPAYLTGEVISVSGGPP